MAEPMTPHEEDDLDRLIREQLQDPEFRAAYEKAREAPTAIFETLIAENRRLRRERDLAVAHDRQPYPTADAYERVCESNRKHRERADKAAADLARERQRNEAALDEVRAANRRLWDDGDVRAVSAYLSDAVRALTGDGQDT